MNGLRKSAAATPIPKAIDRWVRCIEARDMDRLDRFLDEEYRSHTVFPPRRDVFRALEIVQPDDVKAVILGQDPYHQEGQANGLAFSVERGQKPPRSLKNIYRELEAEYGIPAPDDGDLSPWAEQGVLLLNAALTVREGEPGSHMGTEWKEFTESILRYVDGIDRPIAFMLWGEKAKSRQALISNPRRLVLTAPHPSSRSARKGFFGCGHFKACDRYLISEGIEPIDWFRRAPRQKMQTRTGEGGLWA